MEPSDRLGGNQTSQAGLSFLWYTEVGAPLSKVDDPTQSDEGDHDERRSSIANNFFLGTVTSSHRVPEGRVLPTGTRCGPIHFAVVVGRPRDGGQDRTVRGGLRVCFLYCRIRLASSILIVWLE
jgi:hypothetical protein